MTQSLLNQGKDSNKFGDRLHANPKWICADDFRPRPQNQSGAPRMELARKDCGEELLVIYDPVTGTFTDRDTGEELTSKSLEIRIVEIE